MELEKQELKELVKRAKKKDKEAFELLYKTFYLKVYKYMVYKTGDMQTAEDLTQQTFLDAFSSIESFRWFGSGFSSWLMRIAYYKAMDYFRLSYKQKEEQGIHKSTEVEPAENTYLEKERADTLKEAIAKLKDNHKKVIEYRFVTGLNLEETAKVMGKSIGAVKVLQFRALCNLKKLLGDIDV